MEQESFDVAVIGAGPGGCVAAIRAAERGLRVALIEEKELGGVCLNRGCIPSKTLIANAEILNKIKHASDFGIKVDNVSFTFSAMKEKKDQTVKRLRRGIEGLLASNKVKVFTSLAKFLSANEIKILGGADERVIRAKHTIIATGSQPRALPHIPFDYKKIHDSTSLLDLSELPKRFVIIGGGIIGCEFASMLNAFGVDVTILEVLPEIISTEGSQVSETLSSSLKKQGIKIETNVITKKVEDQGGELLVHLEDGRILKTDMILVSVGRTYHTENLGLEKTGVVTNQNGSIPINEYMETNVPNIFAIGDVTGKTLLAHVASHQGIFAADNASGLRKKMHYHAIPSVVYTYPEIASVGLTLEKALKSGYDATIGKFPYQALGRAQALQETEGYAQIVADKKTGLILGAQVVGYGASTLIAEMVLAVAHELTLDSITETIHAHPTLSEIWLEAALLAGDMPIHLPSKPKKG